MSANYICRNNHLSEKCLSIKFLLDYNVIFSTTVGVSSTVQQSLVTKNLNDDVQLQAGFAIFHSYSTNAPLPRAIISKFFIIEINLRTIRSL